MAKDSFMPRKDLEKLQWIENFAAKLKSPPYVSKYQESDENQTDMAKGAVYFGYWLDYHSKLTSYLQKVTQFKNELRDGIPAGSVPSTEPVFPDFDAPPPSVPPGLFKRASSLGSIIKKKSNYTEADGIDMGLEGSVLIANMSDLKPVLDIRPGDGGKPQIKYTKQGTDGIELYVDRGDGNWAFLAVRTTSNYIDTAPLPAGAVSALWKYKAIYRFNDVHVGQWSDVTAITVS